MKGVFMKATISLEGILNFIHSLSLSNSNKQWLGEKLLEEAHQEQVAKEQSYEDFINSMCGSWEDSRSAKEISEDIRSTRQFGITRIIKPRV